MRYLITGVIAVAVVGCASQPASQEAAAARRHAANIAAAADAGYKVNSVLPHTSLNRLAYRDLPDRAPMGAGAGVCLLLESLQRSRAFHRGYS
jgi:hypothetical protein